MVSLNNYIASQFSHPAGVGGKIISSIMNRQNRPLYEQTIQLLQLSDTDSVLDVGCGNGYVLNMLASRYDGLFTGIDISVSIIKTASRRNRRFVENGIMKLCCQDIREMSFADCSFNKAYTINTVYFWENLSDIMAKIRRVLTPNGLFINTFYTDKTLSQFSHTRFGYKRYTIEELTSAGENEGFTVNAVPVLNNAAYCVLYHKTM